MHTTDTVTLQCPYCGEQIEVLVDCSVTWQEYIEDCAVCCRPITLTVALEQDQISVRARREDE